MSCSNVTDGVSVYFSHAARGEQAEDEGSLCDWAASAGRQGCCSITRDEGNECSLL